jgi:two-component system LytT family sensor kinase
LMELPMQAIGFTIMVGAIHSVDAFREAREKEVRAAQLESSLAQSQLRSLRLQLQPHFLFNALNTVSSTMYRDPAAADQMLDQLAELLRASLDTSQADQVSLKAELGILDNYLGIMKARFGERLSVRFEVASDARQALVPSMMLQPLVENAVRHGNAERLGEGRVTLRATRQEHRLVLEIEDDGPGRRKEAGNGRIGTGLFATAERLRLLYGEEQRLEAGNGAGGGFLVRVVLPFREARIAEGECAS